MEKVLDVGWLDFYYFSSIFLGSKTEVSAISLFGMRLLRGAFLGSALRQKKRQRHAV